MNRPIKGDSYRRGQYAHVMFQASANAIPDMRVAVNEGSFWLNNRTLVEFGGGQSPIIEKPVTGAKWVLVAINKLGKIVLYHGVPLANNPDAPKVDKNVLPIAMVFVKSSTTAITNDMIYDARPLYAAGGYPENHNIIAGRDAENCHPMQSITGLKEALDDRLSLNDAQEEFNRKADVDGTNSATFMLNKDDSGTPVEYCGIEVNRGAQPKVGIRFNEDEDQWQYTNDGTKWHPLGNDVDLNDLANYYDAGLTQLSCQPEDYKHPIAVGDNDPRLKEIEKKISKVEAESKFVTKNELADKLQDKVNVNQVYNKEDAEEIFMTKADFKTSGCLSKEEFNNALSAKANASSVFTRAEINDKLAVFYTKNEIDQLFKDVKITGGGGNCQHTVDLSPYITTAQVNAIVQNLQAKIVSGDILDTKLAGMKDVINVLKDSLKEKADKDDVYTKAEVDDKINKGLNKNAFDNYYNKSEINILLKDKLDSDDFKNHGHMASQVVQDPLHRMVSDDQITRWNSKQNALGYVPENVDNKGVAGGYVPLDDDGKINKKYIPLLDTGIGKKGVKFVDTYGQLLGVSQPDLESIYFVTDASDDPTVTKGMGWGEYVWNGSKFIKIGEKESLDLEVNWSDINKKPYYYDADPTKFVSWDSFQTEKAKIQKDYTDLLKGKSNIDHVHDEYLDSSDKKELKDMIEALELVSHDARKLGKYLVQSPSEPADGAALVFNAEKNCLEYKVIKAATGSGSATVDDYKLGSYKVSEPTTMTDGMYLAYEENSGVGKLTYKKLPTSNINATTIFGMPVDNTNLADGKMLVVGKNSENKPALVYTNVPSIPSLLKNIDETNKGTGKVLGMQSNGKLGFLNAASGSGSGAKLYKTTSGVKTMYRADAEGAVTVTNTGSAAYKIELDFSKNLQMFCFEASIPSGTLTSLNFVITEKSGKILPTKTVFDADVPFPTITYYKKNDGMLKTTSTTFDIDGTKATMQIKSLQAGNDYFVKFTY